MAAPMQYEYDTVSSDPYGDYSVAYDDYEDEEEMPATERELAEDAQWKLIQKNTFTRWANEHLKVVNKNINDLETDLSDGLRLLALVEVLSGHKFKKFNRRPNFRTQKLENVTVTLKFLEEGENIRIVNIDSTDIVDSKLKLILGLIWTLILHYSISMPMWEGEDEPAGEKTTQTPKQRLLSWVQNKLADLPVTNFTTNWNDGKAMGALVDSVAPGLCPDWEDWNPKKAKENATEAMDAAEQWLDVPQLIKPEEMINPKVDELSMMTYLSQYPNAKLKPGAPLRPKTNPSRVRAYGPGIEPTGNCVGAPARFIVETFSAGRGEVTVIILNPNGQQEPCEIHFNNDRNLTYSCVYTPTVQGTYKVIIKFSGQEIPKCPYQVGISGAPGDPSKVKCQGPGIEKSGVTLGKKTYFEVMPIGAGDGVVDVVIVDPSGNKDTVRPMVSKKNPEKWYVEYTPKEAGTHSVNVFFSGKPVPLSPFGVGVSPASDAKKCYATGRGIQPKGVRIGDEADFKVHTKGAGVGELHVQVTGPDGQEMPCKYRKVDAGTFAYIYVPKKVGEYVVTITYGGQYISKAPFKVDVGPYMESKIRAYGPGLEHGMVSSPACFVVETNGETGALGFSIEGPSQAKIDCKDNGDGSADITYWPTAPGEYAVHILCNEEDIPKSPYMAEIIPAMPGVDATQVVATGPGLEKNGVTVNKWAEFSIDTRRAGQAPLMVSCMDADYEPVEVLVKDNKDGTFWCRYMPKKNVKHTVTIAYAGVAIPNSPFRVNVQEASNPTNVKVSGPAVSGPVKTFQSTYLIVDCSAAGPGDVAIALTDERGLDIPVNTVDNQDNTFRIDFEPKSVGTYLASIFFADQEIPSSPYNIKVVPSIDVSKVHVDGLEKSVFLESTTDFTVDAKSVTPTGEGKLKAFVTAPSGSRMEVLVNNNKDGTYKCMYTPFEQGPHKLDVTYEGLQIPNSPFNVMATPGCDPTRVKAYGPGLDGGFTNISQAFTVETRGAGQGNLGLAIEGPSEAKMKCRDNRDGSCTVDYLPTCKGSYDINVKFADQHIPGSPFHVGIVDEVNPKRVHVYGKGVDPKGVTANAPTDFTVDASEAGSAPLDVTTTDAVGNKKPVQVRPVQEGIYEASYVPTAEGVQTIDINYAGKPVPGSPYKVRVLPGVDASKVTVSGAGVQPSGVGASLPVSFNVDPRQAGIADLTCIIQDPEGRQIQPNIQRNPDGTYTVTYTPEDVGMYTVTVQYGGQPVPGAPFYVKTSPVGDASKVKVPANLATTVPVGEECVIQLDTGAAGQGNVTCRIHSNADSEADIDIVDNGDGTVSLLYTPRVPGAYTLNIKFGGQPVPQGQITQQAGLPGEDMIMPEDAQGVHSKSPYHPVDFCIPVGPIFNFVKAVVTTPSGQKAHPKIEDNKNGSVIVRYNPTEVGLHSMDVMYNNQPIQGSPFLFHVDAINSGYVTAHGPGLSHGVSGVPAHFTIITKDAGSGGLALAVEGPSKADIQCMDNNDGTCSVSYLPTSPGEYKIIIKFADKHISGSPFTAKVSGPDMEQKRAQLSVGNSSDVSLNVAESDLSSLTSTIRNPSGIEDPCVLKRLPNGHLGISFTPREIGEHLVNVYRNNTHIPNSPFKIYVGESEIGNASKVKVTGRGLTDGMANQLNEFTVNTKDAGYGGLSLSIEGPSKADIECHDNEDGACRVTYKPTEPGNYIINVKFADEHVPGSPFMVNVGGEPSGRITERITRQQEAADITHVGSQCELSLKIPGTTPYDMEASVTSPSGQTEICDIVEVDKCHYSIKFIPKEMGIHTVSVKHRGMHIPGSPFQFTVGPITDGGSHKVKAIGPGLLRGEVNKPCDFNIYTREAGAGGLSIAIEGPSKAEIEFQDRKDGSCGVTYVCSEPGEYLATVKFNDQHIPDSPFKVHIAPGSGDVQKLMVQSLTEQGLQVNKPAAFTIDLNGAQGKLDARVVSPSGAEDEAIIQERDKDKYAVCFVPRENGVHLIHVRLNHNHIPGSPFRVMVGMGDADPSKVRAYGDGLARGNTGVPCKFIVNTVNAGSGALAVTIDGPSKVQMTCDEVPEGYQFQYTPTAPGDYLVTIKYAGSAIPASPFKAKIEGSAKPDQGPWSETSQCVVETVTKTSTTQQYAAVPKPSTPSDASQVTTQGLLAKAFTNKETTFSVDTSKAGHNFLMVGMMGPVHPCEEICVHHIGRNKYKVKYLVKDPGNYVLVIKWGDEHIPGSPFHVAVQ